MIKTILNLAGKFGIKKIGFKISIPLGWKRKKTKKNQVSTICAQLNKKKEGNKMIDYEKKADEIIENSKEVVSDLKDKMSKAGFFGKIVEIFRSVPIIVKLVEFFGLKEAIQGFDKKQIAIVILNRIINIPIAGEEWEGKMIGKCIDIFVDSLVRNGVIK